MNDFDRAIADYRDLLAKQGEARLQAADAIHDAYVAAHMSDALCVRLATGQAARLEQVGRYDVRFRVLLHFILRDPNPERFGRPVFHTLVLRRRDGRQYGSDKGSTVLLDPKLIEGLIVALGAP